MNYDFNKTASSDITKFLNGVALTLDEIKTDIDLFINNIDIEKVNPNNINIPANLLGYPFSNETEAEFKRKLLKTAIDFYKAKGTSESIRILFYTLGLNVEVVPLWTADITSYVDVTPPYIQAYFELKTNPTGNYKNLSVINPDGQLHTAVSAIQL